MNNNIKTKIEKLKAENNIAKSMLHENLNHMDFNTLFSRGASRNASYLGDVFQSKKVNDLVKLGVSKAVGNKLNLGFKIKPYMTILSKILTILR